MLAPVLFQLANGLPVTTARVVDAPVVAVQAWVNAGAADEPPEQAGIAHVFEHMVFRPSHPGGSPLARAVEDIGGEVNAWTSLDHTVFHLVVPASAFETGIAALGEAMVSPRFDSESLDRERGVVLDEMRANEAMPARGLLHEVFASAYLMHGYRRPVIGTSATVEALCPHDLESFFQQYYVARNFQLVVVGDIDPSDVSKATQAHFGGMPARAAVRQRRREPAQVAPRARLVHRDGDYARVALAFHAPPAGSPDRDAMDVLAASLRGVDDQLGNVSARHHALRDGGLMVIDALAAPGDEAAAIGALARRVFSDLDEETLELSRITLASERQFQRETVQGQAHALGLRLSNGLSATGETPLTGNEVGVAARWLQVATATAVAVTPRRVTKRGQAGRQLLARVPRRSTTKPPPIKTPVPTKVVAAAPPTTQPAPTSAPHVVREVLSNGLTVIVRADPSVPVVAARALWLGGTRLETSATAGITSMLAALLVRGCGKRNAKNVADEVERLGGRIGAVAGRNSLAIRAEWMTASWQRGFELLADCIVAPRFDGGEVMAQRQRQLAQLAAEGNYPTQVAFDLFTQTLFAHHPYRLPALGIAEVVGKLSKTQLATYFATNYPLSSLSLVIVGDVDPQAVLAQVRTRLGGKSAAKPPKAVVPVENFDGRAPAEREAYRYLDRSQSYVVIGFPGTTATAKDRFAVEVLTQLLGGQSGRLFTELRDKLGLAYHVAMYGADGVDPGYLAIYVACPPDNADKVVAAVRMLLDHVIATGIAEPEVARTRRRLIGSYQRSLQRRVAIASALAYHDAYGLGWSAWDRYPADIAAVTADQVTAAARNYLASDRQVVAMVRPPGLTPGAAKRTKPTTRRPGRKR